MFFNEFPKFAWAFSRILWWFSEEIAVEKRKRRQLERCWPKSGYEVSEVDKQQ